MVEPGVMRRRALASLALLFLAGSAPAAPDPSGPARDMREIFRLSGLESQLGALDDLVAASLVPNLSRLPAEQKDVVRHAALDAFSGPALQERVAGRLAKVHEPQRAADVLRWLRSPLGRRITLLETQTSTAEGMRALEAYALQLKQAMPPASRVGLAQELDRALGATEFAVELSLACARAAMSAIGAALPSERRLEPEKIEAAIASQRDLLHEELGQMSLVSTLYTYRSLTDTELEAYLAFVRGEAGRWYHGAVKQALLEVLAEQAGRMGASVATALRASPPAPAGPASPPQAD
jgi:hypothetical protein